MDVIGSVLKGQYEIIDEHAQGGMSIVYLARDKNLGSYWAVKQVKNNTNVDIAAFKKEVELLSSLSHTDIPRVVDKIEIGDDFFVVMDLINGITLGKKVLMEGPIPEETVVEWAKILCDILIYIHSVRQNPIVYCDLKPENIVITELGRIKLVDFGIAKECRRGEVQRDASVGTKGYAAPEQYRSGSNILDERTDIYSFGATLYYLSTGVVPGKPSNGLEPIRRINLNLSEGLEFIIDKCTKVDPDERYQSCEELLSDLKDIELLTSNYRRKMRNKLLMFTGSIALSIAFGLVGLAGYIEIKTDKQHIYQEAYQAGIEYEKTAEDLEDQAVETKDDSLYAEAEKYYQKASEEYQIAIENNPSELDTYIKLFNVLLPNNEEHEDFVEQTMVAIDMLKVYVEDPSSHMYHNPTLMYLLAKQCLIVCDADITYAEYALTCITEIENSKEYEEGKFNKNEIACLETIALCLSQDYSNMDFVSLGEALIELEEITLTNTELSPNEKLNNYFIMMTIYERFPNDLEHAYEKIGVMGDQAKAIIDANLQSDKLTFNNIIPMYEIVASSYYERGLASTDINVKREMFNQSIIWFGYLEDLNANLDEATLMKMANTHKAYFDTYNTAASRESINDEVVSYLDKALEIYNDILLENPENFTAQVNKTIAQLDKELVKPPEQRDFTAVYESYAKVIEMKDANENLSTTELSLYISLEQQMMNAGLEV